MGAPLRRPRHTLRRLPAKRHETALATASRHSENRVLRTPHPQWTEPAMHRLPGLDLLRAIAIVWVMLFHSYIVGGLGDSWSWLENSGWAGVDLFFVLSGYLIGSQWLKPLADGRPPAFGRFYLRRALRTMPAFFAVLAVYFAFPSTREAPGIQPLWQFLSYTVNVLIDYRHNQAFSHVWSLYH